MTTISKEFLQSGLLFCQDVAYEAGEILLKFQKKRHSLKLKDKGVLGIASDADLESEKYIMKRLQSSYPNIEILSEEDCEGKGIDSFKNISDELVWVIDPLDGTNNFINGIPIYAVSIGLIHKGKSILGCVYNPMSGECFFGATGLGSYLIDFRINPLKKYELNCQLNSKEMNDCIFSPAPIYDDHDRFGSQLSVFRKNITGARAVRRLGSAALELCYVANGNFDGYWEKGLKPWDTAGASIICSESGAKISDFDGQAFTPFSHSVICAASPLHENILGKISKE